MESAVQARPRIGLAQRAAPIGCGAALIGAAAFVGANNPASAGTRFPSCVFHDMTGLWCPGCGLTRGTYQLLHGHIGAALSYNIFTPVVLVVVVVAWFSWLRTSWDSPALRMPAGSGLLLAKVAPVIVIGYGVLRNIPVAPLRSLAP